MNISYNANVGVKSKVFFRVNYVCLVIVAGVAQRNDEIILDAL